MLDNYKRIYAIRDKKTNKLRNDLTNPKHLFWQKEKARNNVLELSKAENLEPVNFVLIDEKDIENYKEYFKEMKQKIKDLQDNRTIQFVEFNQTLGYIFEQVKKAGVSCQNCKYCKTVLKDGKEQKMCTYYLQRFNLPMEEITNLCEHLEINENVKRKN